MQLLGSQTVMATIRLVADGQVGQNLTVEGDPGSLQAEYQPAVGETMQAGGGIDARDPQLAQVALARAAVAVSVPHALHQRFVRAAEQAMTSAKEALGHL